MEELIARYLKGEATPEQAMELEDWKSEHPDNRMVFTSMEHVYAASHQQDRFVEPNVKQVLQELQSKRKPGKVRPMWLNARVITGAAAVAILAFLLGIWWNQAPKEVNYVKNNTGQEQDKETILKAGNGINTFTLTDSSRVQLSKGSELILAADFNTNGRRAKLKGSGTFEVIHDENNPFVISVEKLEVVDIGTVFNINRRGDTVKVMVSEGAVELRLNGKVLDVAAGDSAFYVISTQLIDRYPTPKARQGKVFVFDGTSLREVASTLSQFFGRKIVVIDDAIADCPLSVTFKDEDLATILDVIKELLDVKIISNKDLIGIYGSGCN